jgi:hypothetical protein
VHPQFFTFCQNNNLKKYFNAEVGHLKREEGLLPEEKAVMKILEGQ